MYRYLVSLFYDRMMRKVESSCLGGFRRHLLGSIRGEVLEIGAGTGVNLDYYPDSLTRLVLCEPDSAMRLKLRSRLSLYPFPSVELLSVPAENLSFADESFDFVVSTLVLCSVRDPDTALAEIRRVLKPGGEFLFLEHVAAQNSVGLYRWQKMIQPLWKRVACNCHLTRDTESYLREAGFTLSLKHEQMIGAPSFAAPLIVGRGMHNIGERS